MKSCDLEEKSKIVLKKSAPASHETGNGAGRKPIENERELEFAVFCIENVAVRLGKPSDAVYRALTGKSDILNQYIVPCYGSLHTQGRDYIINDILEVMEERGVTV